MAGRGQVQDMVYWSRISWRRHLAETRRTVEGAGIAKPRRDWRRDGGGVGCRHRTKAHAASLVMLVREGRGGRVVEDGISRRGQRGCVREDVWQRRSRQGRVRLSENGMVLDGIVGVPRW